MVMHLFSHGQCLHLDLLSSIQYFFSAAIKDIGRSQVFQGFVIAFMIVIMDELLDLVFKYAR